MPDYKFINKVTAGYVVQTYNLNAENYVSQEFYATDECSYELLQVLETCDSVISTEVKAGDSESLDAAFFNDEPYLPFDMVQPK